MEPDESCCPYDFQGQGSSRIFSVENRACCFARGPGHDLKPGETGKKAGMGSGADPESEIFIGCQKAELGLFCLDRLSGFMDFIDILPTLPGL
jgi:hypothetical protein